MRRGAGSGSGGCYPRRVQSDHQGRMLPTARASTERPRSVFLRGRAPARPTRRSMGCPGESEIDRPSLACPKSQHRYERMLFPWRFEGAPHYMVRILDERVDHCAADLPPYRGRQQFLLEEREHYQRSANEWDDTQLAPRQHIDQDHREYGRQPYQ